jgi:hypothetical protein
MAGNKNSGRNRTTTPEDEELELLGKELVEWATEKTKEFRYHVKQFYSIKKCLSKTHWDMMIQKPIFRDYYDRALAALSQKYVDGTINPTIANRFLRLYFPELRAEENETKQFESDIRKQNIEEAQDLLIKIVNYSEKGKELAKPLKNEARRCKKK